MKKGFLFWKIIIFVTIYSVTIYSVTIYRSRWKLGGNIHMRPLYQSNTVETYKSLHYKSLRK